MKEQIKFAGSTRLVSILVLMMTALSAIILLSGCCRCSNDDMSVPGKLSDGTFPIPRIDFDPRQYICYRTENSLNIDGDLDDEDWSNAPWTDYFIDIEGNAKPEPRFKTRAKMLWDDEYLYIAAEMEEPHIWGSLEDRDAVIYHDNDFEVFIDPDGDTHEYYELEVNALGTEWDLLLLKPYRDGGPAVDAWDIQGLKAAVYIDGTLNNPGDVDRGWSIEIAIPWDVLRQCAHKDAPPKDGDQWRVNFSRVEWQMEIQNGKYVKLVDPATGKNLPEDNWVWSPQGLINMHYPEMWGFVQFSDLSIGAKSVSFLTDPADRAAWALQQVYYSQKTHLIQYGCYTTDADRLGLGNIKSEGFSWPPVLEVTSSFFEAYIENEDDGIVLYIDQDGHLWRDSR